MTRPDSSRNTNRPTGKTGTTLSTAIMPDGTMYHSAAPGRTSWPAVFNYPSWQLIARAARTVRVQGILPVVRIRSRLFGDYMLSLTLRKLLWNPGRFRVLRMNCCCVAPARSPARTAFPTWNSVIGKRSFRRLARAHRQGRDDPRSWPQRPDAQWSETQGQAAFPDPSATARGRLCQDRRAGTGPVTFIACVCPEHAGPRDACIQP